MAGNSRHNPNDFFSKIEFWLVRAVVFGLFVVGLIKVAWDLFLRMIR